MNTSIKNNSFETWNNKQFVHPLGNSKRKKLTVQTHSQKQSQLLLKLVNVRYNHFNEVMNQINKTTQPKCNATDRRSPILSCCGAQDEHQLNVEWNTDWRQNRDTARRSSLWVNVWLSQVADKKVLSDQALRSTNYGHPDIEIKIMANRCVGNHCRTRWHLFVAKKVWSRMMHGSTSSEFLVPESSAINSLLRGSVRGPMGDVKTLKGETRI